MSLWDRMKTPQLELLDASPQPQPQPESESESESESRPPSPSDASTGLDLSAIEPLSADLRPPGEPLLLPLAALFEDPANPRTEFPQAELDELAEDIRQHGILQPIVVHPADGTGRFCIHFGAKRFRAAARAGLSQVPVTVRQAAADPYAQVAENQKRHGPRVPLKLAVRHGPLAQRAPLGFQLLDGANAFGRVGISVATPSRVCVLDIDRDRLDLWRLLIQPHQPARVRGFDQVGSCHIDARSCTGWARQIRELDATVGCSALVDLDCLGQRCRAGQQQGNEHSRGRSYWVHRCHLVWHCNGGAG